MKINFRRIALLTILFTQIIPIQIFAQVDIDHTKVGIDSTIYTANTIFVPKYVTPSGNENWGVVGADFDNDGDIDFVTCSFLDSKLNLHLNNGKGEMTSKQSFPTGSGPRCITSGDFNKDGKIDVATISMNDGKIYVHFNTGTGFTQNGSYDCGVFSHWITADDINNDGNLDLLGVSVNQSHVAIFHGDGTGKFTKVNTVITGDRPRVVVVADMDNDGKKDFVTACDDGFIYIHYNDEKNFKSYVKLVSKTSVWGLAVKDLNKDGFKDVAAASYIGSNLIVYLSLGANFNDGKKAYDKGSFIQTGSMCFDLVLDDFDLDGDVDAITASSRDGNVNVHLNDGTGKFLNKASFISGNWNSRILGLDVDGDKDPDIITSSIKDNNLNIHRNLAADPKKQTTALLTGTIQDKNTKKPIIGTVYLKTPDNVTVAVAKTDNNGKFKANVPFDVKLNLLAEVQGYPSYKDQIIVPPTGADKLIELEIITGANVYGKITDSKTLKPLQATIEIKDAMNNVVTTLQSEPDGSYKTPISFNPKAYKIFVSVPKYNSKSSEFMMLKTNPMDVEKNFALEKEVITPTVEGTIYELGTKNIIPFATLKITDTNGNFVKEVQADSNGYYKFQGPAASYKVALTKPAYFFSLYEFELKVENGETPLKKDMELEKLEVGKSIVLKNIFYDVAKATLRPESKTELMRLKQIMDENPTLVIELSGHTDNDGDDAYNLNLSQERAKSVVSFLVNEKIPVERMVAKGYGETKPVVLNDSPANKQKNRRTEVMVLKF